MIQEPQFSWGVKQGSADLESSHASHGPQGRCWTGHILLQPLSVQDGPLPSPVSAPRGCRAGSPCPPDRSTGAQKPPGHPPRGHVPSSVPERSVPAVLAAPGGAEDDRYCSLHQRGVLAPLEGAEGAVRPPPAWAGSWRALEAVVASPRGLPFPPPESARDAGGAAASGQGKTWTQGRCNSRFGRFPFPKGKCLRSYFTLRSWEGNVRIIVIRPFLSRKAFGLQV